MTRYRNTCGGYLKSHDVYKVYWRLSWTAQSSSLARSTKRWYLWGDCYYGCGKSKASDKQMIAPLLFPAGFTVGDLPLQNGDMGSRHTEIRFVMLLSIPYIYSLERCSLICKSFWIHKVKLSFNLFLMSQVDFSFYY